MSKKLWHSVKGVTPPDLKLIVSEGRFWQKKDFSNSEIIANFVQIVGRLPLLYFPIVHCKLWQLMDKSQALIEKEMGK